MSVRSLFIAIIFFITKYCVYSQEPVSITLSEEDGLPDTVIYDIIEDRNGFIWLAASKGLYRYDGRYFKAYSNQDKKGLSVFKLQEDKKGRIWSTNLGGQLFYVEDDKLITFMDLSKYLKGRLCSYYIFGQTIYVFDRMGIYEIDIDTKKVEIITGQDALIGKPFLTSEGVDFYSNKGYERLVPNIGMNKKTQVETKMIFKPIGNRKTILAKFDNYTLVNIEELKKNVFFLLDSENETKQRIPTPKRIRAARIYNSHTLMDKLWFATDTGVHIYKFQNKKLVHVASYLEGEEVGKVMLDSHGNVWFTTLGSGIYVMPNMNIVSYPLEKNLQNISCTEKLNDSTLVLGTDNGKVVLYNILRHTSTKIPLQTTQKVSALRYNPFRNILYISQDNASQIYHVGNNSMIYMKKHAFNNAKDIALMHPDTIMFTSYYGAMVSGHDATGKQLTSRKRITDIRGYHCFYSERTQKSYVTLVNGLASLGYKKEIRRINYKNHPIYTTSMTETRDSTFWVSTFKNGVFGIKGDSVHFHVSKKDGLISDRVLSVKGHGDSLWVVTDSGIQVWNTANGVMYTLGKKDGIPTYNVKGVENFEEQTLVVTKKGLFGVLKSSFTEKTAPEVYFSSVKIMDRDTVIMPHYNLAHDRNKLQFNFNSNGFKSHDNVQYSYRLLGQSESSWKKLDMSTHNVTFQSLSSGDYTFQLKANNVWDTKVYTLREINFSIGRPFWRQWWFYVLVTSMAISILYLYIKKMIRKNERKKSEQLQKAVMDNELISLKMENLRSQMNPHFIFNALNSIQEYIITNKKYEASEYLGRFADLMRRYLTFNETGDVPLTDEVESLQMYLELEALRFEDDFRYHISLSEKLEHSQLEIPIMLVQPYVENALQHGLMHKNGKKKLLVSFTLGDNDNIICVIEDNGIGREKGQALKKEYRKAHRSFAEKATEERLDLFNHGVENRAGIEIIDLYENGIATGTKVVLSIPIMPKTFYE